MEQVLLVATATEVVRIDAATGSVEVGAGLEAQRPTGVWGDPWVSGRAWCCTKQGGVFRTEDGGYTWTSSGLAGQTLMTVVASPAQRDLIWAGAEPSAIWRSTDAGENWERMPDLGTLPSASGWAFPPRPDTHHVRWIACHPTVAERLWVAIEAGALISTEDGGETWIDRVEGGPYDTHELAVSPAAPDVLRSAAGDGYFESHDGGKSWDSPMTGLEVTYLRSVAIDPGDPEIVVVSAASGPRSAYVTGRSDGRLYRREGSGPWRRVTAGWPEPPTTIAPLLLAGTRPGELWAADERGVHVSQDGGLTWEQRARFSRTPDHLRGLAGVR